MDKLPFLDYEPLEREHREKNIKLLYNSLNDESLREKVNNFAEKFDLSPKFVLQKIIDDPIFGLSFAKDPGKQSFHEATAISFIQNLPLISNAIKLPSGGKNAIYVINGNLIKGKDKTSDTDAKSIDFYWEYRRGKKLLKFYATHKYTKVSGGSQNNQEKDAKQFLENTRKCNSNDIFFFAILDGKYYVEEYKNSSRVDIIKKEIKGERIQVTDINKLLYYICLEIRKWLDINNIECNEDDVLIDEILNMYNLQENKNQ